MYHRRSVFSGGGCCTIRCLQSFELKRRHIAKESFCEYCGDPEETLYHVAIQCPLARRFWAEVKKVEGVTIPNFHPSTWATDVLQPEFCNSKTAALVVCGAWTLWTGRNARRHWRKTWEPGAAVRFVSTLLQELAAQKVPKEPMLPRRPEKWRSPEEGWIKVNTDAGFDTTACSGSCGVVIRDQTGLVKAVAARWLDDVLDALTAEAMAAKEGLELAAKNGYDKVILEVDCSGLKTLLDGDDGMRSAIGGLCLGITGLGRSFVDFRVAWVRREANSVAHCCACMVSAIERSFFWLDYIPDWLSRLAAADCTPVID